MVSFGVNSLQNVQLKESAQFQTKMCVVLEAAKAEVHFAHRVSGRNDAFK